MGSDVVVIGGGAIGLSMAEALQRRGAGVTVLEAGEWGAGASAGNAGWVSPGLSNPVPAPGTMLQALRWMPNPKSPLLIRPPRRLDFFSWSYDFWKATREDRYSAGLAALVALCDRAVADFRALAQRGVEFEMHEQGILFVAHSQRSLEAERAVLNDISAMGHELGMKELTPEEALEYEPNLRPGLTGALLSPGECSVRPETLTQGLVNRLQEAGVEMHGYTRVREIRRDGGGWIVEAEPGGAFRAACVVVAAGVATRDLLAPLGVKLPMEGAKGYSVTFDGPAARLRGSLYLLDAKLAISPFDEALRLAGTLELGARDGRLSQGRIKGVEEAARASLHDWSPYRQRHTWAGFRPLTTDGLPVLGPVPGHLGLHVATGHSMLGITLAPTSAELMAPTVLEGGTALELAAFTIARFGNRSAAPAPAAAAAI